MHSVGFEPTHTNILELESSSLDRSDKNAYIFVQDSVKYTINKTYSQLNNFDLLLKTITRVYY
jgi:hypothetical protein